MIEKYETDKIVFVFNAKLNMEYRCDRLLDCLRVLAKYEGAFFSIRLRGEYANTSAIAVTNFFTSVNISRYRIYIGDEFKQWRINTLKQVLESKAYHFLLLQEDHLLISDIGFLKRYIDQIIHNEVQFGHLTAWQTYAEFREKIIRAGNFEETTDSLIYNIREIPWKKLDINQPRYLVPLIGYFRLDLILRILYSNKPYWRKYPVYSPFDFEQGPFAKWLIPLRIAFPKKELFACIDDDIGIPDSSLQSRNLYKLDQIRVGQHHNSEKLSLQNNFIRIRNLVFFGKFKNGIYENLQSNYLKYLWGVFCKYFFKIIKLYDACLYSSHMFLNAIFNFPEIFYKKVNPNKYSKFFMK